MYNLLQKLRVLLIFQVGQLTEEMKPTKENIYVFISVLVIVVYAKSVPIQLQKRIKADAVSENSENGEKLSRKN